ncbi:MAG: hypothetical protein OXH68_15940 [Gammaproteobacteria bacterium]|nr:hypothetical protein [Gammaproteobacteria bacterium]
MARGLARGRGSASGTSLWTPATDRVRRSAGAPTAGNGTPPAAARGTADRACGLPVLYDRMKTAAVKAGNLFRDNQGGASSAAGGGKGWVAGRTVTPMVVLVPL